MGNTFRNIKHAMAWAMLAPMLMLTDCNCGVNMEDLSGNIGHSSKTKLVQADAPQIAHDLHELAASWIWETTEGDAASDFSLRLEVVSDTEIRFVNFMNIDGESITAKVDDGKLTFDGELADGNLIVRDGKGSITNGWLNIQLSFDTYDGEDTEHFEAMLSKGESL